MEIFTGHNLLLPRIFYTYVCLINAASMTKLQILSLPESGH